MPSHGHSWCELQTPTFVARSNEWGSGIVSDLRIFSILLKAAQEGIDLRDVLPKPATAEALLRAANSK